MAYQYPNNHFVYGAEDMYQNGLGYQQLNVPRPKTPGSPFNQHTGLTPTPSGPLSTPTSRHNSQPPEQYMTDHMTIDDGPEEGSDSSDSAQTPDEEQSFNPDLPGAASSLLNFYQTQIGDLPIRPAEADMMMLDNQDFTGYLAPPGIFSQLLDTQFDGQNAQFNGLPDQYNGPSQSSQGSMASIPQPFGQMYATASYTTQSAQQDPWSPQVHRYLNEPGAEANLLDPQSDPNTFSYANTNYTATWMDNMPDASSLISPSIETAAPMDGFLYDANGNISPVSMQLSLSSNSNHYSNPGFGFSPISPQAQTQYFPDNNGFLSSQTFPSPNPSTTAQPAMSPSPYPPPVPSPSSDGASSQPMDLSLDTYVPTIEPIEAKLATSPSSSLMVNARNPSPLALSPVPDDRECGYSSASPAGGAAAQPRRGPAKPPGGRTLGTHLDPKVAKAAHDMRKVVACWHCVLQRDKCGPGDICERCLKRAQRPNTDCGLGCSRVKLIELAQYFLPSIVTMIHEDAQLTHFVNQHIRSWHKKEITIQMTAAQNGLPRIGVKVYEFHPKTSELIQQIQYRIDQTTKERYAIVKTSPPLGMVQVNHNEEKKYDRYVNDIVEHHLGAFERLCWREDDNDFQEKLFSLLRNMQPRNDEETKLIHDVFRLIVLTYIMGRTITIAEESKAHALRQLHTFATSSSTNYTDTFCSPRMTNRQLKYFFNRLHTACLSTLLNKLQQIFKSSKGCDKWLLAFILVLGLAMSFEDQQKTVHAVMETKAKGGEMTMEMANARAELACREIDERFNFVMGIFRWKYMRKCNPIRDADADWSKEVGWGDGKTEEWVRSVSALVKENTDFLSERQRISISTANQTKYTSRLVAQFLLSFWLPS